MELAPQHSWTQAGTGLIDTFAWSNRIGGPLPRYSL